MISNPKWFVLGSGKTIIPVKTGIQTKGFWF